MRGSRLGATTLQWFRSRLDGAPGYVLSITLENGEVREQGTTLMLSASRAGEPLRMRIIALTGETPLTPLNGHLLNASATKDQRSRDVLAYLSYEEKFLAGSWRFDTYFGRDTLMSLRLLMPALQPEAVEGGLAAVLRSARRERRGRARRRHRRIRRPASSQGATRRAPRRSTTTR